MPIIGGLIKRGLRLRKKIVRRTPDPVKAQQRVLRSLLFKARDTEFGRHYDFAGILASADWINAYKSKVPAHNYNSIFQQWWHRLLNEERDITWPGSVRYFALSSGTSEASSKHIPITNEMARAIRRTSIKQIYNLAEYDLPASIFEKGILMIGGSTNLQQRGSYFEGDLSGISASKIPLWFQRFYKPGKEISKVTDWSLKLEEMVNKAPDWDIGIVVGVPAWIQLLIEMMVQRYNLKHIHEMWPNLSVYVHGGVAFDPYRQSFEKLMGRPIEFIETYLASEGFIAFQTKPGHRAMSLVLNNGIYYEFIPFDEHNFTPDGDLLPNCQFLTIDEVEEGKQYALLLSTCAGAWRYLIGDVIKFTSKADSEIVISGRTRHYISMCGEHLSVENMNKAIELTARALDVDIKEFTVSGINYGSLFAHKWYVGCNKEVDNEALCAMIDNHLKDLNDDYRVERGSALKAVVVEQISNEVFYDWMAAKGKSGGQHKFPRVMNKQQFAEWEHFVQQHLQQE